jgi:L-ascorbate metabolism protein UlaG (beta-lactamase superfamily)
VHASVQAQIFTKSVRALEHKQYNSRPWAAQSSAALPKAPLLASAYVEGGTVAYLLRIAGHQILIMGSMNYIEREMLGLRPDIAIIGSGESRTEIFDYTGRLLRALNMPAVVLPTHWDSYRTKTMTQAVEGVERFFAEVRSTSPSSQLILPRYFSPIGLP